jgi:hypothetical protein
MKNPLNIDDIEGTRPNKFHHSKRGYQQPIPNPFDKFGQSASFAYSDGYLQTSNMPVVDKHGYGNLRGTNNLATLGQNMVTMPDYQQLRNPVNYGHPQGQLQPSTSKLNLMESAPQDSLDAFQQERKIVSGEHTDEGYSKYYGVDPSTVKNSQAPTYEAKIQSPQNIGLSSPKGGFSPYINTGERAVTDYDEAIQARNSQFSGTNAFSPKRTGRGDNYENTANRFYASNMQAAGMKSPKMAEKREASPEDTVKMRNPMFADYNYSKYEADGSIRKTRFNPVKDESLELIQKKGIIENHLSYPSQGSTIQKSWGDFYGIATSPSVSKSFYDQIEAVKTQANQKNQLNNTYSHPSDMINQAQVSGPNKFLGSVQPRQQPTNQPYFLQGGQGYNPRNVQYSQYPLGTNLS